MFVNTINNLIHIVFKASPILLTIHYVRLRIYDENKYKQFFVNLSYNLIYMYQYIYFIGDYFAVKIAEDKNYGTPVFITIGGASKCPGQFTYYLQSYYIYIHCRLMKLFC